MSYLLKFLLVHMLIAINVKHFESNMKSCLRFWNHNAVKQLNTVYSSIVSQQALSEDAVFLALPAKWQNFISKTNIGL